eukprot:scaffold2908_cov257-Pinguiococcus_pyrenoidosus.AAC.38
MRDGLGQPDAPGGRRGAQGCQRDLRHWTAGKGTSSKDATAEDTAKMLWQMSSAFLLSLEPQVHHVFGDQLYGMGNREPPEGFEPGRVLPITEILPDEQAEGEDDDGDGGQGGAAEEGEGEGEGEGNEPLSGSGEEGASASDATGVVEDESAAAAEEGEGEEEKAERLQEDHGAMEEAEAGPDAGEDMDDLLWRSFLQALRKDLRSDSKMPILANVFFATMVLPRRPVGTTLNIKRTSYRKFSSFLVAVEEEGIVDVEDGGPGQEFIVGVNRQHEAYRSHRNHEDVKSAASSGAPGEDGSEDESEAWGATGRRDFGARLRPIEVHTLYRLIGKSVALLQALLAAAEAHQNDVRAAVAQSEDGNGNGNGNGNGEAADSKDEERTTTTEEERGEGDGDVEFRFVPDVDSYYSDLGGGQYLSPSGLRNILGDYVRLRGLSDRQNPKMLAVDAVLQSSLYLSAKKADVQVGGRVSKKDAVKLWQSRAQTFTALKTHENAPHVIVRGLDPPKVAILVEKLGKHYSSHIVNLETFNIDLQDFTRVCSRRFAASASVSDCKEGKPGQKKKEVLVQGNLTAEMPQFLQSEYGIPQRLVDVQQGKGMSKKKKR